MSASIEEVWAALEDLADPEIPVISLRDLGILRDERAEDFLRPGVKGGPVGRAAWVCGQWRHFHSIPLKLPIFG